MSNNQFQRPDCIFIAHIPYLNQCRTHSFTAEVDLGFCFSLKNVDMGRKVIVSVNADNKAIFVSAILILKIQLVFGGMSSSSP